MGGGGEGVQEELHCKLGPATAASLVSAGSKIGDKISCRNMFWNTKYGLGILGGMLEHETCGAGASLPLNTKDESVAASLHLK